jgi:hypothetical protein
LLGGEGFLTERDAEHGSPSDLVTKVSEQKLTAQCPQERAGLDRAVVVSKKKKKKGKQIH